MVVIAIVILLFFIFWKFYINPLSKKQDFEKQFTYGDYYADKSMYCVTYTNSKTKVVDILFKSADILHCFWVMERLRKKQIPIRKYITIEEVRKQLNKKEVQDA